MEHDGYRERLEKGREGTAVRGKGVRVDDDDIRRAIRYVELNPSKEGKPARTWSFVTPFEG